MFMFYDSGAKTESPVPLMIGDCRSCPPWMTTPIFVKFDPSSLKVTDKVYAPVKTVTTEIKGVMHNGDYLVALHTGRGLQYAVINIHEFVPRLYQPKTEDFSLEKCSLYYTGRPGYFITYHDGVLGLWNSKTEKQEKTIRNVKGFYKIHVQDNSIYLIYDTFVEIIEELYI